SGWRLDSQKSELPQRPQKDRVPWSDERKRTSPVSPVSRWNWLRGTENQVTKAAPWLRWHIVQWQWPQKSVGSAMRKRIAPHKQDPATRVSDMAPPTPEREGRRGARVGGPYQAPARRGIRYRRSRLASLSAFSQVVQQPTDTPPRGFVAL